MKDGDNYYGYYYNSTWLKENADVDDYEAFDFYAHLVSCFKNDYSAFVFSNGVYTASSLDKTDALDTIINDVKIVFSDGALVSIKFKKVGATDYGYEIKEIGNTTISLPLDYTEIN